MRPQNKSRSRNKQGNSSGHNGQRRNTMGNVINRVFESAGPDGKVRGTPQQIIDKYQALARDAQLAGDRVAGESYLQHSEHYSRLLNEAQREQQENRFNQERVEQRGGNEEGGFDPQQQRRPQPMQQPPVASGLAMIEPEDSDDFSGPVETPESRRQQSDDPRPAINDGGERRERRERRRAQAPAPVPAAATSPATDPATPDEQPRQEPRAARPENASEIASGNAPEIAPERARRPTAPAPRPEPVVQAEAPAPAPATDEASGADEPAPAPKRRRRPRAEAPAPASLPVVEAE